jgi:hypothetical protein
MNVEKNNFRRRTNIMNNHKLGSILQSLVKKNMIEIENNHLKFEFETDGKFKIFSQNN